MTACAHCPGEVVKHCTDSRTCDLIRCQHCGCFGTPDHRRWTASNGGCKR